MKNCVWMSVHMLILTVEILSLLCHAAFNNFPIEFWVSWNRLKSKNISGRSSYTRHLNYYVSKGMTAHVREADMSPCSYVLFILELEAIINYLGVRQAWTRYIRFTPVPTVCSKRVNPFNSYFNFVQLILLVIADILNRYWDMIEASLFLGSPQHDPLQWLQDTSRAEEQYWWSTCWKTHLFFLIITVWFLGNVCYSYCQIFLSVRACELCTCCLLVKWERRRHSPNPTLCS